MVLRSLSRSALWHASIQYLQISGFLFGNLWKPMVLVRFFHWTIGNCTCSVIFGVWFRARVIGYFFASEMVRKEIKKYLKINMFVNFVTYTLLASSSTSLDRFFNILSTSMLWDFKTTPFIDRFTISLHSFITLLWISVKTLESKFWVGMASFFKTLPVDFSSKLLSEKCLEQIRSVLWSIVTLGWLQAAIQMANLLKSLGNLKYWAEMGFGQIFTAQRYRGFLKRTPFKVGIASFFNFTRVWSPKSSFLKSRSKH